MKIYLAIDIGASSGRHIAGWLEDGKLKLHLFVDASIVEIYADEGRTAMSCLAFPGGENYGVSIMADGAVLEEACGWTLDQVKTA